MEHFQHMLLLTWQHSINQFLLQKLTPLEKDSISSSDLSIRSSWFTNLKAALITFWWQTNNKKGWKTHSPDMLLPYEILNNWLLECPANISSIIILLQSFFWPRKSFCRWGLKQKMAPYISSSVIQVSDSPKMSKLFKMTKEYAPSLYKLLASALPEQLQQNFGFKKGVNNVFQNQFGISGLPKI